MAGGEAADRAAQRHLQPSGLGQPQFLAGVDAAMSDQEVRCPGAEGGVFFLGLTIAGAAIWPALIADFALAYLLGIVFQYFAIVPMRGLGFKAGVVAAVKADTLSIAAYEIGMFAWMALVYFVLFHPHLTPDQPAYWFMMQIAMIVGFATSYPMNRWLIKRDLKEAM